MRNLSIEDLHSWAINDIEYRKMIAEKEAIDCVRDHVQGVARGMARAYKDCGVLSQEEYDKYIKA